jgi:hypothetical protein
MKGHRRAKPTALRELHGNTRKEAKNVRAHEPIPIGELTDPPETMTESQHERWRFYIEHTPRGMLKHIDRSALASLIIAEDTLMKANEMLSKTGLLIRGDYGPRPNPLLGIMHKAQMTILGRVRRLASHRPAGRASVRCHRPHRRPRQSRLPRPRSRGARWTSSSKPTQRSIKAVSAAEWGNEMQWQSCRPAGRIRSRAMRWRWSTAG